MVEVTRLPPRHVSLETADRLRRHHLRCLRGNADRATGVSPTGALSGYLFAPRWCSAVVVGPTLRASDVKHVTREPARFRWST